MTSESVKTMKTDELIIAVDGPASSGKSTVAKRVAKDLDLIYVDTGAMYRALTWQALNKTVNIKDEEALVELLSHTVISFERIENGQIVYVNDENVTDEIRENEVTNTVSVVAAHPKVRIEMVKRQQRMAENNGVIMDGRDIGTVVLPNADVKIFLVASVKERAERRHKENKEKGIFSDLEQLKRDIADRDYKDSTRATSPLKQAKDAIRIDTTNLSIEKVVDKIKKLIKTNLNETIEEIQ